ncbi:MAG: 5-methyltetrahydropteroyltriglutamate--homocysteine S-methyltransferase [Lachnospiraceae bacterium]|nr:5-methyltetrahydropteroyltriglutamate--homocysteine S-methyltransferase [Lachnospiraceae bacterium]
MRTSVIGFPRIGRNRELKFASEKYFNGEITEKELLETAEAIKNENLLKQKEAGITFISSNDFSFYDNMLDTAVLFNVIPKRYKDLKLSGLDTYFAMARGYQGEKGNVKALAMKKWFNTNYHYLVPEIDDDTKIELIGDKPVKDFEAAGKIGVNTKTSIIGPFTFLKLTRFTGSKNVHDVADDLINAYVQLVKALEKKGEGLIEFDEPRLVMDLSAEDKELFKNIYNVILESKGSVKILLQTFFGDIRDIYDEVVKLDFDAIGLDFVEGRKTAELVKFFPKGKVLFAGLVNGKNIWINDYSKTLSALKDIATDEIVLSTSCSLLHVPYTLDGEAGLDSDCKAHFSFAREKLSELKDLGELFDTDFEKDERFIRNKLLHQGRKNCMDSAVQSAVASIKPEDYERLPKFEEREKIQKDKFRLPLFPTTTIGSFPQTADVRKNRLEFKKGLKSKEEYIKFNQDKIRECIKLQEEIGLDVIVHGEFERNDMVEYFGENLSGFLFTKNAWVQSYGTRCVKPAIIWGDVARKNPITVEWSKFAKSCTDKPVKGMLTGPVTILNWSFPREDISIKESTLQIALAIRDEVLDLEKNGIDIIQIDEAALREKLPLRKADWYSEYLDWAIPAFRLVHSKVKSETQIHTHMCYSEFTDIIPAIDAMDADVITFEASRSDLLILDALRENNFKTEVGPGVYDIHSPRVPSVDEIVTALTKMRKKIEDRKLWVNPDCGLKTRGEDETVKSLKNLVAAAKIIRG